MSKEVFLIRESIDKAMNKARKLGLIIGYVSRKMPSKMSGEESTAIVEVDPITYYKYEGALGVGNYLVAIDIRSGKAVGLRITSVTREDIATSIESFQPLPLGSDEAGLLTNAVIHADTLLDEDGLPFTYPVEPQSPVVVPNDPKIIAKVIGLPESGVPLGILHTGSHPIGNGKILLNLPKGEFFKHMLIIGTTGSGKTTFIKNLLYFLSKYWIGSKVFIVDAAGDYTQIVLPPPTPPPELDHFGISISEYKNSYPNKVTVLLPLRRGDKDLKGLATSYVMERLNKLAKAFYGRELEIGVVDGKDYGGVSSVLVKCSNKDFKFSVEVVPLSLSYLELKDHLEIFPLFSRQAKVYLRNVVNFLEAQEGGISNFTHLYIAFKRHFNTILETLKVHKKTLENIERAVNFIASSSEVDVFLNKRPVGMPKASQVLRNYEGPVILDLDYASYRGAHFMILNIIAYEFMREIYSWKRSSEGIYTPILMILDEAHRFFPSEGTSQEEVELLADFISRIARLGRARGLGLIFSTHSPKDVHKIVNQLTNTKVIFRSEREFVELLDVPKEYIKIIELVPDRIGMIRTSTLRSGHAIFQTPQPLLGHYDIGKLTTNE